MISVVVPVFNEEHMIAPFLAAVQTHLDPLQTPFEIIFCLDPSTDKTAECVREAHRANPRIKAVQLSRRFGQPMATLAGLRYASGDAVIVMDVDLQDPPSLIPEMIAKWKEDFDVVYAKRKSRRGETVLKCVLSSLGYSIIRRIARVDIPAETGDFRLMNRRVVDEILKLKESHGYLRGLVALVGFRQVAIEFDRPARLAGWSHYNRLLGSLQIATNGIICFSSAPLWLSTLAGLAVLMTAFAFVLAYAAAAIGRIPFPISNPLLVGLLLFLSGTQLLTIGILGEYVSRIYDEVKERPHFIVDWTLGF